MLLPNGHLKLNFPIDPIAKDYVLNQNWEALDQLAKSWLEPTHGPLHQILGQYCEFSHVEHILALRQGPDDDDGIWHDDGSRLMAFSLSLTLEHEIVSGGKLSLRARDSEQYYDFPCQPWGTLILFNTGQHNYEHKVSAVTAGKRLVMAGWCS